MESFLHRDTIGNTILKTSKFIFICELSVFVLQIGGIFLGVKRLSFMPYTIFNKSSAIFPRMVLYYVDTIGKSLLR